MYSVTSGNTISCGKCDFKNSEYWLAKKWGTLCLNPNQHLPKEWGSGSERRMTFTCGCGRQTTLKFNSACKNVSCGKCGFKSRLYWISQKWEKLRLDPDQELPDEFGGASHQKVGFLCDCGRTAHIAITNVVSGHSTSCGRCSSFSRDYWIKQEWGELRVDPSQLLPDEWKPQSHKKMFFICRCGRALKTKVSLVTSGNSLSCGKCKFMPLTYWLSQKWGKLKIDPDQELPEEWGSGYRKKVKFICDCGTGTTTTIGHVVSGDSNSCGCSKPGTASTSPAYEIYDFVKTLASDVEFSYWFKNNKEERREYDIYVPSKRLAIEYHGLHWHREETRKKKDYEKFLDANKRGDRLIQIYQDEWTEKREIVKALILFLLDSSKGKQKRTLPLYSIEHKTHSDIRSFLNSHHYLGAAGGCLTIIARHPKSNEIIGVWVFMKREAGTVLWHRACWDHRYRAWNPHEKALKMAIPVLKSMGFKKIVTFSDNRFHTGRMYEKIGFQFEKELKPDYSYTDGKIRRSKYALRVRAGKNESISAAEMGWFKIWDSGKKRYSYLLT